MHDPREARTCRTCQMADPPPDQTCRRGRDHYVGTAAGCPACGRLTAVCALRPCPAARGPLNRAPLATIQPITAPTARQARTRPQREPAASPGQENQ